MQDEVRAAIDLFARERRNDTSSEAIAEYLNASKPNGIGRPMTADSVDRIMGMLGINKALAAMRVDRRASAVEGEDGRSEPD